MNDWHIYINLCDIIIYQQKLLYYQQMSILQQAYSNNKSLKATMKFNHSTNIKEESSMISLNIEDLRTLMKKKEKEFQTQLQIEDAKRVHSFLVDIEQQKKVKAKEKMREDRQKAKMAISRYNEQTLRQFQEQWNSSLQNTLRNLQQIRSLAQQQYVKQLQQAKTRQQQARNGKSLQNVKFSREVLELQDQLKKLVKAQRYQEATIVQKMLQSRKKQFLKKILEMAVEKETKALQHLKKQQLKEKKLLTDKLNRIYLDQQEKQAKEIEVMIKNMRTYQIDMGKIDFRVSRISRTLQSKKTERNKSTNFQKINIGSNRKPAQDSIKNQQDQPQA